jgi:PAS domain S-box-containing protein
MQLHEEERKRLSQQLHDSAGQKLAAAKMNLDILALQAESPAGNDSIREIVDLVAETIRELRGVAQGLHTPLLEEEDLRRRISAEGQLRDLKPEVKKHAHEIEMIMQVWPLGLAIAHDPECRMVARNAALCEMLGIGAKEGQPTSGADAELPFEIYQDGKQLTAEELPLRRAAKSGPFQAVLDFRRADGEILSTLVSASPLLDDAGNVRGAVAAHFDLTNLELMEEQLRERAELLELASEAIIVRDHDGIVQFWNAGAEALYGWKREEMLGMNLHRTLQTQFPDALSEMRESVAQTGRWEGNLVQRTKDGLEITVACRKALGLGSGRGNQVILEVNRDITARLQAEEVLRQTERWAAMGRVAGVIAHEINNPLESIVNAFFLLNNHSSLDAQAREYLRIAQEELSRIVHITKQTLGFYRESQQVIPISATALLDDVLDLQLRALRRNRIALEKEYWTEASILGFPVELKQVFLNLTGNAIQAMPEGGQLRVRVREAVERNSQRRGIEVSITDTGSGIKPEDAGKIFEPFFTTKATKGTGLGLWISKGIVQKYEGTIRFRSLRLPHGAATCFSVFFPGSHVAASADAA